MTSVTETKMDKTVFQIISLDDEPHDTAYWVGLTPTDRLAALELLRQVMYGYDPTTTRLQRVLTWIGAILSDY